MSSRNKLRKNQKNITSIDINLKENMYEGSTAPLKDGKL